MIYNNFIQLFTSQEGLEQLIAECKDTFDALDDLAQRLQQNIISTPEEWKEVLAVATGHYAFLNPLYVTSIAIKENEELRQYISEKNELEAKGEKVVATNLDKSASLKVSEFRRIRNILEGYTETAEKIIATAQSQLKRLEVEIRNRNTEINE